MQDIPPPPFSQRIRKVKKIITIWKIHVYSEVDSHQHTFYLNNSTGAKLFKAREGCFNKEEKSGRILTKLFFIPFIYHKTEDMSFGFPFKGFIFFSIDRP